MGLMPYISISDQDYHTEYSDSVESGPLPKVICSVSNAKNNYDNLQMNTSNLFTIYNLNNFVWVKKNTTTPDYTPGVFNGITVAPLDSTSGTDWIHGVYTSRSCNNTSSTIYILDENYLYKRVGNYYKNASGEKIPVGLYPKDNRLNYETLSNKWLYSDEKESTDIEYSIPTIPSILNNNYIYNYNKYKDGTLVPPLNGTDLNTYLNKFGISTNISRILPSEFIGSYFSGSDIIDFDASSYAYARLDNLMKDKITSRYDISNYNWSFDYTDDYNWTRRCKYLTASSMPQEYHLAFLYFAYYSSNNFFDKLSYLNICKHELGSIMATDSECQYPTSGVASVDSMIVSTYNQFRRGNINTLRGITSHIWRNNRYLVKNYSVFGERCLSNASSNGSIDAYKMKGIPPAMVTRIGKTTDNRLYMIYDVPLIPNHKKNNITKEDIASLLETILDGNTIIISGPQEVDTFNDFRDWLGKSSNETSYLSDIISKIRNSSARDINASEFIDYYRAAVGTVWRNMPSSYNKQYGTKVFLSGGNKILTNEIYIAINAPGAGGGHGQYNNPDDYVAHGGNAGSAGVFKINIPKENLDLNQDMILCNIYSIGLGGDPYIMKDYDDVGALGTYARAGNAGSDVIISGRNAAYIIQGGQVYPYNADNNESYNYDQTDNDNNYMQHISDVLNKRSVRLLAPYADNIMRCDVDSSSYFLSYADVTPITGSGACQTGNLLAIKPYPNVEFTNNKIDLMTLSGDELDTLPGLDTSKDNYNKWTCGVYKHQYSSGDSKYGTYFKANRPGTPPITTDIIDNIDDPMHECSAAYAGNSIFYHGGSTIFEAAVGDGDYRNDSSGEYYRENLIREYVDGRKGSGGGGLSDSGQNNGFLRSGKGGSMAFQLFWYSSTIS